MLDLHAAGARCQCDGAAAALQQLGREVCWSCVQEVQRGRGGAMACGAMKSSYCGGCCLLDRLSDTCL